MNIFTYGSLMFPEVWTRVTGLTRPGLPARLTGHAARRIQGAAYPALVPCPGALTEGILYEDVPPSAVALLDAFEGDFYERLLLEITQGSDGTAAWAGTYVASHPEAPGILPEPWNAAEFARDHLQTFLNHDPGFATGGRSALDATGQAS